jgi:hypothetical protein
LGNLRTPHSLLITHLTDESITYHDPAFAQGPVSTLLAEFLLAWSDMDEQTAFLYR